MPWNVRGRPPCVTRLWGPRLVGKRWRSGHISGTELWGNRRDCETERGGRLRQVTALHPLYHDVLHLPAESQPRCPQSGRGRASATADGGPATLATTRGHICPRGSFLDEHEQPWPWSNGRGHETGSCDDAARRRGEKWW